jgi:phosphopantothenoylcysteine decarboxylase/phosphopantothenate--cysteine ligase
MSQLAGKRIILGVTGSIAAYKAADLVSQLVKYGADVQVVMTKGATQFITPMTLQVLSKNPVGVDIWEEGKTSVPGHIEIADLADLLLVAPISANVLAEFAHGLAPDLLTSVYLAARCPVVLAPAMNGKMYEHAATQNNLKTLKARGHVIIEPVEGMLACGYEGNGKLAPVDEIVSRLLAILG